MASLSTRRTARPALSPCSFTFGMSETAQPSAAGGLDPKSAVTKCGHTMATRLRLHHLQMAGQFHGMDQ